MGRKWARYFENRLGSVLKTAFGTELEIALGNNLGS